MTTERIAKTKAVIGGGKSVDVEARITEELGKAAGPLSIYVGIYTTYLGATSGPEVLKFQSHQHMKEVCGMLARYAREYDPTKWIEEEEE